MSSQISVLYIDDEPINLMIFERVFRKSYNIVTAESGQEGIELLNDNNEIQVVISDMKMPKMNGIEFITMAKNKFPDKAYFILTGYDMTDEIKDAINNNLIHNSFSKPFKAADITSAIDKVLS